VGGITLRNDELGLRPLTLEDLPALVSDWPPEGFGGDPSATVSAAEHRLRRRVERSGRFVGGRLDLAIEVDGQLVGTIEARQPVGGLPPGVFEVGISLFAEGRGRGTGTGAIRLLTGYLFDEPTTHRVQASTAVGNQAMRRVLEKAGYVFEGVLRDFLPGRNGREDSALYGITRSGWESLG
jgi:RimJ/RimL family protein N-acetyltransferase